MAHCEGGGIKGFTEVPKRHTLIGGLMCEDVTGGISCWVCTGVISWITGRMFGGLKGRTRIKVL